ncbi:hypothetical protein [Anaeroselena agilis]|uniref:Lipoprotein n=1 Tax=Anaeroselena agilis TaxID=3063788 RepID=A0ABU3P1D9_9FIRM|nr:hypothetical protein [Selenomonadales bacterium 4137-cl]
MERTDKTAKLLGLFMAALLTVTAGCSAGGQSRPGHTHIDRNSDGYCDEDGEQMPARAGGGHFYGVPFFFGGTRSGVAAPGQATPGSGRGATISSGKARGGIGGGFTGGLG